MITLGNFPDWAWWVHNYDFVYTFKQKADEVNFLLMFIRTLFQLSLIILSFGVMSLLIIIC